MQRISNRNKFVSAHVFNVAGFIAVNRGGRNTDDLSNVLCGHAEHFAALFNSATYTHVKNHLGISIAVFSHKCKRKGKQTCKKAKIHIDNSRKREYYKNELTETRELEVKYDGEN